MLNGGNVTLRISKDLDLPSEKRKILKKYLDYCSRVLRLDNEYVGYLVTNREKHKIETTAICYPLKGEIFVYSKDRSFADILRSIGHELVHCRQYETAKIEDHELHFASEVENEANAIAGQLLNAFSAVIGYDIIYEGKNENC
jgi:Zn-dependent peptidase ImmA (M78 family)